MWFVWSVAASAQGIVNGDFEIGTTGWSDEATWMYYAGGNQWETLPWVTSGNDPTLAIDTTIARGAASGRIETPFGYWGEGGPGSDPFEFTIDLRSAPFVVTHTELHYAIIDAAPSALTVGLAAENGLVWIPGSAIPAAPSADTFEDVAVDVGLACGTSAIARLYWHAPYDHVDTWWIDDLTLDGPACPQFTDVDGDGLCTEGADLDSDGDCADMGELRPGERVDCDDGDPAIGACLHVTSHDLWMAPNAPYDIVIGGASPGEEVRLVTGSGPGTTCPPALGPRCLDLAGPLRGIDRAIADANGTAMFSVVPRRFQAVPYSTRWLQGVVLRPGGALVSAVVAAPVRPEAGPPPDPGFANGDFEGGLVRWVPASAVYQRFWWEDPNACRGGTADPAGGRGAASLYVESVWEPGWVSGCANTTRSWPVHVTHRALTWAHRGSSGEAGRLKVFDRVDGAEIPLDPLETEAPDGFTEAVADLGAACGTDVYVDISGGLDGEPGAWWDDVALTGPPCAELVDGDGDGACAEGLDFDGDGACVSSGEYLPGTPDPEPLARVLEDLEHVPMGAECPDPGMAYCSPCLPWYGIPDTGYCPGAFFPWSRVELRAWADHPELPPLGGYGLWLDTDDIWWGGFAATDLTWGDAFGYGYDPDSIVTHERLGLSVLGTGVGDWRSGTVVVDAFTTDGRVGLPVETPMGQLPPQVWGQHVVDVSASCGEWLGSVEIRYLGSHLYTTPDEWEYVLYANVDEVYVDDFGFLGPACAIFVDGDGDGTCPEGIDLDGDGECVSASEPTPGVAQEP